MSPNPAIYTAGRHEILPVGSTGVIHETGVLAQDSGLGFELCVGRPARIARQSDYDKVARLCRRAVGPRDYVLGGLREMIRDRSLFLALQDGQVVGITNFERCIDGSGWLSAARTDPAYRGRGIAAFLQQEIASYARRREIRTLRLWTSPRNRAALRVCRKVGFRKVCEAAQVSTTLRRVQATRLLSRASSLPEDAAESLLRSDYLSKMNGYFAYGWHFVKASKRLVERIVAKHELYSVDSVTFVLTKPKRWGTKLYGNCALLKGSAARSLGAIKEAAKGRGVDVIFAYLPYDPYLLRVSRQLGFRRDPWGKHCVVFEKKLD